MGLCRKYRTNNTSENKYIVVLHCLYFFDLQPECMKLRRTDSKRTFSIQIDTGASVPKQSTKTKAFQMGFDTLHGRYIKKEINAKELLLCLSLPTKT